MITGLNTLYEKLNNDYTYLFEYKTYGMDEKIQKKVALLMKEAKEYWFNTRNLNRLMHIRLVLSTISFILIIFASNLVCRRKVSTWEGNTAYPKLYK